MPIDTQHPQYNRFIKRWKKMDDALADEIQVKEKGEEYLKKTYGMQVNDPDGKDYENYKDRARFPEITTQGLTGMMGLIFEKEPVGVADDIITNTGQNNLRLARDVMRAVGSKGRDILVVDAPPAANGGGEPFIARYAAESLINWKVDEKNAALITLAVFEESANLDDGDEYSHETEKTYRQYKRLESGKYEVSRLNEEGGIIEEAVTLPLNECPIICAGSIDTSPACDPLPLLPVALCAFAFYRKSATYENALQQVGEPTPWVKGVSEELYKAILAQGIGASSLWHLGNDPNAQTGMLETSGNGIPALEKALDNELQQAETYAVRLTQTTDGTESAAAIGMRAATQHATIYSVADSVSIAINRAQKIRAKWAGVSEPDDFVLEVEVDQEYAGEQMINALNGAINAGNSPIEPMFEAIRKAGLSEMDNEEMARSIANQIPANVLP